MYIYSHFPQSKGSTELAAVLKAPRISHVNSTFRGSPDKVVINWGSSNLPPEVKKCKILNNGSAVEIATNKKKFFQYNGDYFRIPPWTDDWGIANAWLEQGRSVVCRSILQGSGGEGITILEPTALGDPTYLMAVKSTSKLYTAYIPKKSEYRLHFCNKEIFLVQQKIFKLGNNVPPENINWKVRNHSNGFIFIKNDLQVPDEVMLQGKVCALTVSLDFGAIDVIYNEKTNKAFVLEINTAPGLEGTTITSYAEALKAACDKLEKGSA